jgi:Fic family protein
MRRGWVHRRTVHFEAPAAHLLDADVDRQDDPIIKAGLAHLWCVTLHPFDDGNGRIARAVGGMALACAEGSVQRFYSLSAQIQRERRLEALGRHTPKHAADQAAQQAAGRV